MNKANNALVYIWAGALTSAIVPLAVILQVMFDPNVTSSDFLAPVILLLTFLHIAFIAGTAHLTVAAILWKPKK